MCEWIHGEFRHVEEEDEDRSWSVLYIIEFLRSAGWLLCSSLYVVSSCVVCQTVEVNIVEILHAFAESSALSLQ